MYIEKRVKKNTEDSNNVDKWEEEEKISKRGNGEENKDLGGKIAGKK